MNIEIGSLVSLRRENDIGIVLKIIELDGAYGDLFAQVYWQTKYKTRLEFVGDLRVLSD